MSVSISRTVELAMGHRLRFHKGKCRNYHGHNYNITFHVDGPVLVSGPGSGMVCDFSELKSIIKAVLEPFDHAMCLHEDDEMVSILRDAASKVVTMEQEPTAENLSKYWLAAFVSVMASQGYHKGDYQFTVTVAETSDTSASSVS